MTAQAADVLVKERAPAEAVSDWMQRFVGLVADAPASQLGSA